MIKKIKDLTLKEIANICSTHHCFEDCPILDACEIAELQCIHSGFNKFTFEQEIEVEDDEQR